MFVWFSTCRIQFQLAWKGRQKMVKIYWFQNECDASLNSNMYDVAYKVKC